RRRGSIELTAIGPDGERADHSLRGGDWHNQRPVLAPSEDGLWVAWDAFDGDTYNIYSCPISPDGPGDVQRVDATPQWCTIPALTIDGTGKPFAAWIVADDVMNNDDLFDTAYRIECAARDGGEWKLVAGADHDGACVDLRYGLLLGKPRGWYTSYRGRRRKPVLRTAQDGSVWLIWERKEGHNEGTAAARGLLLGRRYDGQNWSDEKLLNRDMVFYEIERGGGPIDPDALACICRDVTSEHLHFEICSPQPAPPPAEDIDFSEWSSASPAAVVSGKYGEPSRREFADAGDYTLLWADMHNHSNVSIPPCGEADEMLTYGLKKAGLDVCAITDNDHCWGGRTYTEYDWNLQKGWVGLLNRDNEYVVFPGYEFSVRGVEMHTPFEVMLQEAPERYCNLGEEINHRSVYGDDDNMQMLPWRAAGDDPMQALMEYLHENDYFCHPHHGRWQIYDERVEPNVEACSGWGMYILEEDRYEEALLAGQKIGFIGGSDNHRRIPGLNGALTGVWAKDKSRAVVEEALRSHRCYATAGDRIALLLKAGDAWMGESVTLQEAPELTIRARGQANADYTLHLIRDGEQILSTEFTGEADLTHTDEDLAAGDHYYRVEVRGPEPPEYPGNIAPAFRPFAFSSALWVTVRES
ncbi:MAG: CehA/McbA family metallohydrolase, partial [Armatimonadota bacterium]